MKDDSLAVAAPVTHTLDLISRAASDPTIDVEKLERLLAMHERVLADQRRTAFMAALSRLQERLPQITKAGAILDRDGVMRNRYAKLEDIDAVVRPLCAEEGFAFSYDSEPVATGIRYSCKLSHRDGHAEIKTLVLPVDQGAGRNAVQSVGSSTSYARRYLLGMHLNLITRDEDDGGAGGSAPITADQAAHLRASLAEVGGSEARFLKWASVSTIEELPSSRYEAALRMIEEKKKRRTNG